MAKYKSLVSTLFIYNKICENLKKLENFEISTYLGENFFSRVKNFSMGGEGLRTLWFQFLEGGSKHPLRTLDGCADLLGGLKSNFEFLGGVCAPSCPRMSILEKLPSSNIDLLHYRQKENTYNVCSV